VKTVLLGGSSFIGPEILSKYPDIVPIGRTRPNVACEHLSCPTVGDLVNVLGGIEFEKVMAATVHRVFEADIKLLEQTTYWEPRYELAKGLTETNRNMEAMQ
jgi:hypothetical protein